MAYRMGWTVTVKRSVEKAVTELPLEIQDALAMLIREINQYGPTRFNWANYSKLQPRHRNRHHCHLKKGHPTYVACWEVTDKSKKLVEVYYAGTHEKAPY